MLNIFKVGCLVFIVACGGAMWLLVEAMTPGQPEAKEPVIFQVREGQTGTAIAEQLEEQKLITSALALRVLMKFKRGGSDFKVGYFRVDPTQPAVKVYEQLLTSEPLTRKATVPEGYILTQIATSLEDQGIAPAEEVYKAATADGRQYGELFPKDLEGYLFPSTYEFPWDANGEDVVRIMTHQFEQIVTPLWEKHSKKTPLDLRDTIILASLVEREAQVASERPIIAGVYLNRIRKGMKLQCDATVQFALGKPKKVLLYSDLEVRSPYNTYIHAGLPPGPIACPGEASIEAAMNPKKSDYLFYVRNDVKNDGSHVFTRNYAEHQRAIAKYQR